MERPRSRTDGQSVSTVSRRTMVTGAVATGVTVATHNAGATQSTPQATPETDGGIDTGRLMRVSANLCGGAILKQEHADTLLDILNSDAAVLPAFEELETVEEFTEEAMTEVSPEAQALAANILQYWFLGRYNGDPIENRSHLFFDLACWQPLPYSTQPSTCKSFGYWAAEIEL